MGLIRRVRGWPLRALPTNLSFQPDDGLGSNGHPGAAAILINQKNGERTAGVGLGTCELNLGQKLLHLSRRQKKEPKGYGGEEIRKMGS